MRPLVWTCALLVMLMYLVGVYLTQLVSDHMFELQIKAPWLAEEQGALGNYFGDLPTSMLSLFQAITNGVSWRLMAEPLEVYLSPWVPIVLCVYMAFAVFALFNIITGVFVDSALKTAHKDQDIALYKSLLKVWTKAIGSNDLITRQRFADCVTDRTDEQLHESMRQYFEAIGISPDEHQALFDLLDMDGRGEIYFAEFVDGCFHLRGPVKALVFHDFMRQWKKFRMEFTSHAGLMWTELSSIKAAVNQIHDSLNEGKLWKFTGSRGSWWAI